MIVRKLLFWQLIRNVPDSWFEAYFQRSQSLVVVKLTPITKK